MKKLSFLGILILTMIFFACENSNNKQISTDIVKNTKSAVEHAEKGTPSIITFEETEHFFGDVIQGEKVILIVLNFTIQADPICLLLK